MIEGRTKLLQISAVHYRRPDGSQGKTVIERVHRNVRFKRYLPAGPLPGGAVRLKDLVQFYTDPGGLRTVNAEDLVL
jgi:hypothetical protein